MSSPASALASMSSRRGPLEYEHRPDLEFARAEDAHERDRGARADIQRNRPHVANSLRGEERHGRDRPARRDRDARHDPVGMRRFGRSAQVLDRGNQAEVDRAVVKQVGALRRHIEPHLETRRAIEAIDVRTGVEVPDRADANRRHEVAAIEAPVALDRLEAGSLNVPADLLERERGAAPCRHRRRATRRRHRRPRPSAPPAPASDRRASSRPGSKECSPRRAGPAPRA